MQNIEEGICTVGIAGDSDQFILEAIEKAESCKDIKALTALSMLLAIALRIAVLGDEKTYAMCIDKAGEHITETVEGIRQEMHG